MFSKGPPRQRCVINSFFSFRAHQKSYFYKSFFTNTRPIQRLIACHGTLPVSRSQAHRVLSDIFCWAIFCEKRSVCTRFTRILFTRNRDSTGWNLFALRLMNGMQVILTEDEGITHTQKKDWSNTFEFAAQWNFLSVPTFWIGIHMALKADTQTTTDYFINNYLRWTHLHDHHPLMS